MKNIQLCIRRRHARQFPGMKRAVSHGRLRSLAEAGHHVTERSALKHRRMA